MRTTMREGMIRPQLSVPQWGIVASILLILASITGLVACSEDDYYDNYEVNDGVCHVSAPTAEDAKALYQACASANRGSG